MARYPHPSLQSLSALLAAHSGRARDSLPPWVPLGEPFSSGLLCKSPSERGGGANKVLVLSLGNRGALGMGLF